MEISAAMVIGNVMRKLADEGVTDFDSIAEAMQTVKNLQNSEGLYSNDRFTELGSDSQAMVITEGTGQKQECILWCINHYLGLNRNPRVIA